MLELSGFNYEVKKELASRTEYNVYDADRFAAKEKLENHFTQENYVFKDGVKSSSSIDIKTLDVTIDDRLHRFFFKPRKGGGSGAGAEVTALGECFQAYMCAARQKKGSDLETAEEGIELLTDEYIRNYTDCDRTIEQCILGLDPGWMNSGVVIANKFAKQLVGSTRYTFLRGGDIVKDIEDTYNKLKKPAGITLNINKWNPSDIWAMKHTNFEPVFDHKTLDEYNEYLLSNYNNKNLIGLSLKKLSGSAKTCNEELFNGGKKRPQAKFLSYSIAGKRGNGAWRDIYKKQGTASKDVYLKYKVGNKTFEMQIRTFSNGMSGWQGEIKGTSAAGGKIGGGNLQNALELAGIPSSQFIDQSTFKSQSKITNKKTIKQFTKMYNELSDDKMTETEMTLFVSDYNDNWLYSKYLCLQFIYVMITKKKKDVVMSMLDSIASSSTPKSSVFLKYS